MSPSGQSETRGAFRRLLTSALLVTLAAECLPAAEQSSRSQPRLQVELRKEADRATVTRTTEGLVVSITSPSGIGGATLLRPATGWPKSLTLQLRLKGLESLWMENGAIRCETSLGGPERRRYWKATEKRDDPGTAVGELLVKVTRSKAGVEIVLPGELTRGNPAQITVRWIDFFR